MADTEQKPTETQPAPNPASEVKDNATAQKPEKPPTPPEVPSSNRKVLGSYTTRTQNDNNRSKLNYKTETGSKGFAKFIIKRRKPKKPPPFVLDCCKVTDTVLPQYNGLKDRFLSGFFERPRIKKHLVSMRIVPCFM